MAPAQRAILEADLPADNEKLTILKLAVHKITQTGYLYIGMEHFAKPKDELVLALRLGLLQRKFLGY